MRAFDGYGGLIHCITMHLPAENPIRILHYPVRYYQNPASTFPIAAKITNKSGIQSAVCKWRMKGAGIWNTLPMSFSGTSYEAAIPGNMNAIADTIEYYIEASSNNGKTIQRPITAPSGYYTFYYGTQVVNIAGNRNEPFSFNLYPNPAHDHFAVEVTSDNDQLLDLTIYDITGKKVKQLGALALNQNRSLLVPTQALCPGIYIVEVKCNNLYFNKKLVVE